MSRTGICPARIRTGDEGDDKHQARLAESKIYKWSKRNEVHSKLLSKPRKRPVERQLWVRTKMADKDCNICVAAMMVTHATSPEEGKMEFDEARTIVYDKGSKDIVKAFMVVSREMMNELYEKPRDMYAADEAIDTPQAGGTPRDVL